MPSFVESVAAKLKGKIVEIYLGDVYEQINLTDVTINVNGTIVGKLIDADGDCLEMDCHYVDQDSKIPHMSNTIYINSYNIKAITEINGSGVLSDIFTKPKLSRKIVKPKGK